MKWRVSSKESGWTLQQFLRHFLPELSAKSIKRQLEQHRCRVNGRLERFSSAVVGAGDTIEFSPIEVLPPSTSADVLFEDPYIKIVNKPAGVTSESFAKAKDILVHRLDKPTSGVFILAKSPEVYQAMVALFRDKKVEKTYLALVSGVPTQSAGKVENSLGKIHDIGGQSIWGAVQNGLYALTYWKVLAKGKKAALIEASPITGRTHQIRVHLASLQMPLVGDAQYSGKGKYLDGGRVMLHAYRIRFPHPNTQKIIEVTAPVPSDFHQQLKLLDIKWDDAI